MSDPSDKLNFERQIFVTICGIFAGFMAYYVLNDLLLGSYFETLIGDLMVFGLIIAAIVLVYIYPSRLFLWMNLTFIMAIIAISLFWPLLGGSRGPLPFTIIFIISMVGILFPYYQRIIYIAILIILVITLIYLEEMYDFVRPLNVGTKRSIPLDFILNMIGIAVALSYLRARFDRYHNQINENNIKLHQVNNQLKDQNGLLKSQGKRIEKINSTLMDIVDEQTRQLDSQKETLKQQALQSAQNLRAPIEEILELLPALEHNGSNPTVQKFRNETARINETIGKVNDLLVE